MRNRKMTQIVDPKPTVIKTNSYIMKIFDKSSQFVSELKNIRDLIYNQ